MTIAQNYNGWVLGADYVLPHVIDDSLEEPEYDPPHSEHYKQLQPEPIEVIEAWGLDFHLGNAVKYIARSPYKGTPIQDLEKAVWYLQRKIENEKNKDDITTT